jgi:hypothetical protein
MFFAPSFAAALAAALASAFMGGDARVPDRVAMQDGTRLEGRVLYEDEQRLILRSGSRDRELSKHAIADVDSRTRRLDRALSRWSELNASDARAVFELVQYCKGADLVEEARLFALHIATLDPTNVKAHEQLGHVLRGNEWIVRGGADPLSFEALRAGNQDWGRANEFASTHFRVRTNVALREALGAALDLEGFYRELYDLLQGELQLLEVVEPMRAELHASARSFPELTGASRAYYDPDARTLYVDASISIDRSELLHEATHAIFHATSEHKSARGSLPAWVQEGLAEYLSAGIDGPPGRPRFLVGNVHAGHARTHSRSKDPYALSRVLNFTTNDFLASSHAELKYSQAYTLVHYCMHGAGRAYRRGFLEYLRGAYAGQSSSSDFKDAVIGGAKDFESGWHAHAVVLDETVSRK